MAVAHKRSQGFTLLELSVVLVIIGVVSSAALVTLVAAVRQRQFDDTVGKMKVIQNALVDYRRIYNRIPCPGDISLAPDVANFGVEAANSTCTGGTPAATYLVSKTAGGSLPVKTLGLPIDYAFDGWGRRLVYFMDTHYSEADAFVKYPINNKTIGSIVVKDANATAITSTAIELLLSLGENGHGAYLYNGGVPSARYYTPTSTNTSEWDNCNCNASAVTAFNTSFVQRLPYQNPATKTDAFDDIVLYKNRANFRGLNE